MLFVDEIIRLQRISSVLELNQISDEEKITGNFHFVKRPKAALQVLPPFTLVHQIPGDHGAPFPSLFHRVSPLPLPPSTHPSLSLFRIISFESTIMGRRGHAGHVFTKVCAPNTKAAWQTGSIPRVAGRRHTMVLSVISRCPLVGRPVVLCAFLPFFLPARRRIVETWEDNTLCRKGRRDIVSQRGGLLWFMRSRKGSS